MKNSIQNQIAKAFALVRDHKIISVIVGLVIIGGGYYSYTKASAQVAPTRYVLGQVEKGTLITSISGTGQVSASNQVDVKPKASGQITNINVSVGKEIKAGTIIAQLDARDALQSVRDAQADLTSARIALEKTKTLSTETKQNADESLSKAYEDSRSTLSDLYISYSGIVDDINDLFYTPTHSPYFADENLKVQLSFSAVSDKNNIGVQLDTFKSQYDLFLNKYQSINQSSTPEEIEAALQTSNNISKQLSDVLKNTRTFLGYVQSHIKASPTELTSDISKLDQYVSTVNNKVSTITSLQKDIRTAKSDVAAASQTYSHISGSSDPLEVQSAELTVTQRQNAYQKALNNLADYTVRAPFDGLVAAATAKKGDNVSSGTSIATLMTQQKIATVSLNEIDAAKVNVGQKVTLTFDAISDFTISGQVIEVDPLGTVSQGVVSYNVKIGFDTQDDRIKPGMSTTAAIITESKPDVLIVPTTAVKTNANGSYVETLDATSVTQSTQGVTSTSAPHQIPVEIGSANDSQTEIISGVKEGDQIITRTITASTQTSTQSTQRSGTGVFGVPTGGGRAGGNFGGRIGG